MKQVNETKLFNNVEDAMLGMIDTVYDSVPMELSRLVPGRTLVIIVDMVNGFAKEGALSSPRVKALIPVIEEFQKKCNKEKVRVIAFEDGHTENSLELRDRPAHCLVETVESNTVEELLRNEIYSLHKKNSTNAMVQKNIYEWIEGYGGRDFDNFIIVGCCTDICIQQLALTMKAFFNERNLSKRVIVPMNMVDTYETETHNADLMNVFALYQMIDSGVEVVSEIE